MALIEAMKKKFKLDKKKQGYSICNINNPAIKVATQILAGKVMQRCCADEVPMPVIALAAQYTEGVEFNYVKYLCGEFLVNFCEA